MKKTVALLLILAVLLSVLLLPAGALSLPGDPLIATAEQQIASAVGSDTAGAAVGIFSGGNLIFLEGFGYADITDRTLVTLETVFEIGKLSRIFVALAAYRLAEEGRLSLTAPITDYLPAHVTSGLALSYPVTTEQLLLGCAGFEGRTFDLTFTKPSYRFDSLEKALLAEVPRQVTKPGEIATDSPFGIALAAFVVECAAGCSYADYVREQILTPLGMTSTVLDPDEHTDATQTAVGHIAKGEGVFSVAAREGRTYAGLYPASGALSSAADLAALLRFLLGGHKVVLSDASRQAFLQTVWKNGAFSVTAPALSARENAVGLTGGTLYFGASLWIDVICGVGAFVLTDTADSSLLTLPEVLCNATAGVTVENGGTMPELETFVGAFATADGENHSFVGRLMRKEACVEAEVTEGGELLFCGESLRQIAPCMFAKAGEDTVTVQFLLDQDGAVRAVLTAKGEVFYPVSFSERTVPATVLLILLLVLAFWFLIAGVFSFLRYLIHRGDPHSEGFLFTLPLLFAALMSLSTLLQVAVGVKYGGAAFSSFFGAMSVITLLLGIGATVFFLLSFFASVTRRGMTSRVARTAILFVGFVILVHFWGLSVL